MHFLFETEASSQGASGVENTFDDFSWYHKHNGPYFPRLPLIVAAIAVVNLA